MITFEIYNTTAGESRGWHAEQVRFYGMYKLSPPVAKISNYASMQKSQNGFIQFYMDIWVIE